MLTGGPHRRFDPLRGEWVVVSPQRTARPWQGQVERAETERAPEYDPSCYLCPGNVRANGDRNPQYPSTFAFDNDFAALLPTGSQQSEASSQQSASARDGIARELGRTRRSAPREGGPVTSNNLFSSTPERGVCRVLCFHPRHDLTLARMDRPAIRRVIDAWVGECASLAAIPWMQYALVFENRGAMMGASNPHPHCQIWGTEHVPNEPSKETAALEAHRDRHGSCLLCAYADLEIAGGERVVCVNDHFAVVVPFWAEWPFETLVVARRHVDAMRDLDDGGRDGLADILKRLTIRYDNLFETPFPYSMGFHQSLRADATGAAHLHAHFYPPLLRSATVRKFMVGFELFGSPQRDLTPEDAAARLQALDDVHYSERSRAGAPR